MSVGVPGARIGFGVRRSSTCWFRNEVLSLIDNRSNRDRCNHLDNLNYFGCWRGTRSGWQFNDRRRSYVFHNNHEPNDYLNWINANINGNRVAQGTANHGDQLRQHRNVS